MIVFYLDEDERMATIEIEPMVKTPNIDDALVSAYCYIVDPEGMDELGNYAYDFTFQVWRTEETDDGDLLGFVVGNPFLGYIPLWVEDSFETIYLMRSWLDVPQTL